MNKRGLRLVLLIKYTEYKLDLGEIRIENDEWESYMEIAVKKNAS